MRAVGCWVEGLSIPRDLLNPAVPPRHLYANPVTAANRPCNRPYGIYLTRMGEGDVGGHASHAGVDRAIAGGGMPQRRPKPDVTSRCLIAVQTTLTWWVVVRLDAHKSCC